MSPSSNDSSSDVLSPAAALPGTTYNPANPRTETAETDPYRLRGVESGSRATSGEKPLPTTYDEDQQRYMAGAQTQPLPRQDYYQPAQPLQTQSYVMPMQPQQQPASMYQQQAPVPQQYQQPAPVSQQYQQQAPVVQPQQPYPEADNAMASPNFNRHNSSYGDWLGGAALGAGAGALGTEAYRRQQRDATIPESETSRAVEPSQSYDGYARTRMDGNGEPRNVYDEGKDDNHFYPGGSSRLDQEPAVASLPPADTTAIPAAALAGNVAPSPAARLGGVNNFDPVATHNSTTGSDTIGTSTLSNTGSRLGGLESRGAHETGRIFPSVLRHDTDMSVSGLHVPGEFPMRS